MRLIIRCLSIDVLFHVAQGHTNCVNNLRFSPDGRWIASAGEDGILKVGDLLSDKYTCLNVYFSKGV